MPDLIKSEDYENLPEDPEDCFLALEAICRANLLLSISSEDVSPDYVQEIQRNYMFVIASAADQLGIVGLAVIHGPGTWSEIYRRFSLQVQAAITRLNLRRRTTSKLLSVALEPNTKTKIRHHIGRIRESLDTIEEKDGRKSRLVVRLAQFEAELDKQRLSFAGVGSFMCQTILLLGAVASFGSDVPAAVRHAAQAADSIMRLIGEDKETEERAQRRLAPPAPALPAPPSAAARPTGVRPPEDDIPF
jgi:hypothetical protein